MFLQARNRPVDNNALELANQSARYIGNKYKPYNKYFTVEYKHVLFKKGANLVKVCTWAKCGVAEMSATSLKIWSGTGEKYSSGF